MNVIVIGAGMTGIAAGYYLRASKIPYTILEAKSDVGGVWASHRWHGARCDSDFIKYSFSFKPFLSERCLQGRSQIQTYLRGVAEEFDILPRIRFDTRVLKVAFDSREQRWSVHTSNGVLSAQFLINGNGYFADEPYVPAFEGAERFKGEIVHTSHLDERRTFAGKKVVLVGSGSTAICCAPELAAVSASLTLLQRSPSYIYEISNQAGPLIRLCQSLYQLGLRAPLKWLRHYLQLRDDLIFLGFRRFPRLARWFFRRHWAGAVDAQAMSEHFTPRYDPWEQRIAVAIGLKKKLRSGAITMKTAAIQRFTDSGILLSSGEHLDCDVCVLATGLNLRFFAFDVYRDNTKIALERINFYKGFMVGGIPNYFHPMGSWHSAWTQRAEPLLRSAIAVMKHMQRRGYGAVSVRRKELAASKPGITPNYVMRSLATMPRFEGITAIPTIDNLFAARVDDGNYHFAAGSAP
ncbi:MAG TPA: NAD(P)/FAD-dependent oxidoreductase [Burkholderiales bacterium]|nr:NAD(P)/FAD-dependent oxidoreductase [Burkholderiales bacterium]